MVKAAWAAACYAAIIPILAEALAPRNVSTVDVFYTTQVVTQLTTVTDHTTDIETDIITVTQTAYVITTGLPFEGTKTVTETLNVPGYASTIVPQLQASPYLLEDVNYDNQPTTAFPTPETPHATLQPAVHFDTDLNDVSNLVPADNHDLYYTADGVADPNLGHTFASLNANYSSLAVVLEHSASIGSVTCETSGLIITFTTTEAFDTAQQSWPATGNFLIISHTSGCGSTPADEAAVRSFFAVSKVVFSGLSAIVSAIEVALEGAIQEGTLTWGTYTPGSNSSSPTGTSETPAPTPTSFTGGGDNGTACGTPPAATISGFPTAPCGDGFDEALDKLLGYVSFSDGSFSSTLESIAPGLGDYSLDDYQPDDVTPQRRKSRRGLQKRVAVVAVFQKVVKKIVTTVKQAPAAVKQAVTTGVNAAQQGIKAVGEAISNLFNPSVDTTIPINLGPKKLVDSPFGQAFQIFKREKTSKGGAASGSIGLYCVNCGVTGQVRVQGKLAFSIVAAKITAGSLAFNGNIKAGVGLGLAAEASYDKTFTQPITSVGIPGFSIPNIVTVGPVVALDVELNINIQAQGQILVGADVTIPNFAANIDLVDGKKSFATGFTPQFQTYFNVSGEITAQATLGVPLTVGIGIDLVPLKQAGRRLISIKNRPGVQVTAKYAYSNTDPGDCNNGISYNINLVDDTTLDLFGLASYPLFPYKSPNLASKCFLLGTKPTPTSTAEIGASETAASSDSAPTAAGTVDPAVATTPDASAVTPIARLRFHRQLDDGSGSSPTSDVDAATPTAIDDSDPNDSTFQALESLAATNEDAIVANKTDTDGLTYITVTDSTGAYILMSAEDGNLNVQAAGTFDDGVTFATFEDVIVSDDSDRFLHYYPETMTAFGVSRIRLSGDDDYPATADLITLSPLNYDDSSSTPGVFVAVDTNGDYFYPVICDIDGQSSKIFLVADPSEEAGLKKLTDPDLRFIVTGGVVTECQFIAFLASGAGY